MNEEINFDDFEKVDLRLGTVLTAEVFEQAKKPAYILTVDFGSKIGILKSSAQITDRYAVEDLVQKQIIAVVNFPPKQIANLMSQCLVLGIQDENGVSLLSVDHRVENGLKVS